jgi:hypothetical protein
MTDLPPDLRKLIDNASPACLRAMFEAAYSGAAAGIAAKQALIEGFGLVLDLLRAGKISEATEVAERLVIKSDTRDEMLAEMIVMGRA